MASSAFFAFLAGILSVLSPCVLPLLPVVLGTAVSKHRFGPAALAGGLALSFVGIGLFIATVGFAIGLDGDLFRSVGGLMLAGIGIVLLLPRLQSQLAAAAGPVGNWTEQHLGGFDVSGLKGQFGIGLLLGVVWSPCVGPTLGAASVLAARGESLGEVASVMALFGLGAALPLLVLGMVSRVAMLRWRHRMMSVGQGGKLLLGGLLVIVGLAIVSGLDKRWEAALVAASPDWLTQLTTRF